MQDKVFDMLVNENDVTWQGLLTQLIRTEEMNPWDIDISLLVKKYVETVMKMRETNFFISGKVLLAASILLKVKSNKLVNEEIARFDDVLFAHPEEDLGEFEELRDYMEAYRAKHKIPKLAIKTPQARKRTVTINDLVSALQKALEVEKRREVRRKAVMNFLGPTIPTKKIDISDLISKVFEKIKGIFSRRQNVTFTSLLDKGDKEDKICTFLPLLHLSNDNKIDLYQEKHFGEIDIKLK